MGGRGLVVQGLFIKHNYGLEVATKEMADRVLTFLWNGADSNLAVY